MRTIETTLYQFSELTETAQKEAIDRLRCASAEAAADADWEDASHIIDFTKNLAKVYADIDMNSQGWYVNHCFSRTEEYNLTDEEEFEKFRKEFKEQFKEEYWCDRTMLRIVEEWRFCDRCSYATNVAECIKSFCEDIYRVTLTYYDDECVKEWICMNDFEFRDNGRLYQG